MKVNLISLGCQKNLVDSEKILGALGASGISVCALPQDSDVILVNTCGFIKPALEETESEIKKVCKCAKRYDKRVYVFGCAVNRFGSELKVKFPEVSKWFKLEDNNELLSTICAAAVNVDSRLLTTQGYAYLKIADGCSNHCSYCTIPSIKGEYHSFDFDKLIKEAIELSELGAKEIILIAQDTTRYGVDVYDKQMLVSLIREISKIHGIEWIRILYAHPKTINEEMISEIEINKKICKYLDMPIQHISNRILNLMNRGVDRQRIKRLIKQLRRIKGISLRTTVITGFPGETDDEFNELLSFLSQGYFDWLGVFPYFCEPGTDAAQMEQVSEDIIDNRYKKVMDLQQEIISKNNASKIGKVYKTLIHSQNRHYIGHTEFSAPEIDNHVLINNKNLEIGRFYDLRITKAKGCDIYGKNTG